MTPNERREAALRVMRDHHISQRRACRLVGVDPKTVRRERPPDCPEIRREMQEIAGKRRRFGYRRIGVLLERRGMIMNHKKLYRLYREEGLSVKRRRGRKRARGTRTPMPEAACPNARWPLDFLSDSFGASRKFRILAAIDDCCRENLCLVADTSISGERVARELDALVRIYGKPGCIVSDNGTEFTSRAILKWADKNEVPWHYIDLGKPQQNAFIESFNGIHENLQIKHGSITTIHDVTNTQTIVDRPAKDLRRARSALNSLIPTTTGSATAITLIYPELTGRLNGHAVRVPLLNASLIRAHPAGID